MKEMKIAIFGGSFDPVHAEHINIVKAAAEKLETDKIIVIPAYIPPHKQGKSLASAQDRLNMAKLAFGQIKNCEVSSFEISAGGTSYTYRTLQYFREKYPQATFYLLVGADMLKDFYTWKHSCQRRIGRGGPGRGKAQRQGGTTSFFCEVPQIFPNP